MNIRKNVVRSTLILFALTQTAQAYELLCSKPTTPSSSIAKPIKVSAMNDQFRSTSQFSSTDFTVEELMQLFSTGRQTNRNNPTLVCMLPEQHATTRRLFSDMGVEPVILQKLANKQPHSTQHVRLVKNESEMIECVKSAYPSIGYIGRLPAAHQKIACFE